MTKIPTRAPRPSIRRRPQSPQSVDEFIQAGTGEPPPLPEEPSEAESPTATTEQSSATSAMVSSPSQDSSVPYHGEGKFYFALFVGFCALGVAIFNSYYLTLREPLVPSSNLAHKPEAKATPPVEVVHSIVPPPSPPPVAPAVESNPITQPPSGIQGVQWLALTDLQFARHDLLLGLNAPAQSSLILAKVHLGMLGKSFSAEVTALDRILSRLQNAPVLLLGQLDHDIESLKEVWLQVVFGHGSKPKEGLLDWLTPWRNNDHNGRTELETTDAGRYLVSRLDRLKWLALWGDEQGLRQVSASLENILGPQFTDSFEAKPWLLWIRGLQRIPLRHDVTDLNTLIVRLSRVELPP
ncbi:hypothetical protein CCP3SC1AL1_1150009 [Gammaproteobacteria bacterium]